MPVIDCAASGRTVNAFSIDAAALPAATTWMVPAEVNVMFGSGDDSV
jgi:hypothetical protein